MTSEKKKRKQVFKDRSNIITLCERHIIDRNHEYFDECDRLTFLAKNLYNATLYQQRQSFFNKSFRNYYDVNKDFTKNNQQDYRMLPAKVAKQVQLLSDKAFKSFFALLKLKEKGEYDEPVKIPKYLDKTKVVNVPFASLRSMLAYKCLLAGINFITSEEAHTSKCSFIDRETIEHHDSYCGRRVKRGLFKTGSNKLINADVNGSLNIGRKYLEQLGLYTDKLHDELLAFMVNPRRITIFP